MSACIAATAPDRAFLMSDAAVYNDAGVLTAISSKIILLPALKAAGSCRGNLIPLRLVEMAIEDFGSWDAFRPNAPAVFEAVDQLMTCIVPGRFYEFVLVGWSAERDRAEVVFHTSHDQVPEGFNLGRPTLITETLIPRGPGLEALSEIAPFDFDPRTHGLEAMEQAHRTLADLRCGQGPDEFMAHSVGGFVQLVTITPEGITSEILRNWPDQIGRPIEPEVRQCLAA